MYYSASSKRLPLFSVVSMRNLGVGLTTPIPKMFKRLRMRLNPKLHEQEAGYGEIGEKRRCRKLPAGSRQAFSNPVTRSDLLRSELQHESTGSFLQLRIVHRYANNTADASAGLEACLTEP
jgi:hypothetical protein